MATEYIVSKNSSNDLGIIGMSKAVFESIAELSIEDFDDVKVAHSSTFQKGVSCKVIKENLVINISILVATGVKINDISRQVQERIHDGIVQMTSFKNIIVNVNVVGFYYK